jgi:1-deoxy-D-xylulose-5-phosphate synthase
MTVMAPKDENELRHMFATALRDIDGPVAIRYPRGAGVGAPLTDPLHALPIGRAETIREGDDVAILALGTMVLAAERAATALAAEGISATVVNARFVKPLDERLVVELAERCGALVTVEEHARAGGFGSAILELLASRGLTTPIRLLAASDKVYEQASQARLRELAGLSTTHIADAARSVATIRRPAAPLLPSDAVG